MFPCKCWYVVVFLSFYFCLFFVFVFLPLVQFVSVCFMNFFYDVFFMVFFFYLIFFQLISLQRCIYIWMCIEVFFLFSMIGNEFYLIFGWRQSCFLTSVSSLANLRISCWRLCLFLLTTVFHRFPFSWHTTFLLIYVSLLADVKPRHWHLCFLLADAFVTSTSPLCLLALSSADVLPSYWRLYPFVYFCWRTALLLTFVSPYLLLLTYCPPTDVCIPLFTSADVLPSYWRLYSLVYFCWRTALPPDIYVSWFSSADVLYLHWHLRSWFSPTQCAMHGEPQIMFSTTKRTMLCITCFRESSIDDRLHCIDLGTAYTQGCKKLDRAVMVSAHPRPASTGVIIFCFPLSYPCLPLLPVSCTPRSIFQWRRIPSFSFFFSI